MILAPPEPRKRRRRRGTAAGGEAEPRPGRAGPRKRPHGIVPPDLAVGHHPNRLAVVRQLILEPSAVLVDHLRGSRVGPARSAASVRCFQARFASGQQPASAAAIGGPSPITPSAFPVRGSLCRTARALAGDRTQHEDRRRDGIDPRWIRSRSSPAATRRRARHRVGRPVRHCRPEHGQSTGRGPGPVPLAGVNARAQHRRRCRQATPIITD